MSYYLMKVNQQKNPSRVSSYLKENNLEGGGNKVNPEIIPRHLNSDGEEDSEDEENAKVHPEDIKEPLDEGDELANYDGKSRKKPFHSIFNFNPPLDNDVLLEKIQKKIAEKGEEDGITFGEYKVFYKWYSQKYNSYFFIVIKNKIDPNDVSRIFRIARTNILTRGKVCDLETEYLGSIDNFGGVRFSNKNGYLVTVANRDYVSIKNYVNLKDVEMSYNI